MCIYLPNRIWLSPKLHSYRVFNTTTYRFSTFKNVCIEIPIMGWHFIMKCFTFFQYFLVSLCIVWNLIIFNSSEVTHVFAWPSNDFWVMTNVHTEKLPLCKNCTTTKWCQRSIRFCIHCECSLCLPQASAQHKPS